MCRLVLARSFVLINMEEDSSAISGRWSPLSQSKDFSALFGPSKARIEGNTFQLRLCKPKNLLEKKRMLLRHTCYDTNGSAWKASASGTLFSPWID